MAGDIPAIGGKIYELKLNVNNESDLQKVYGAVKKDKADNVIGFDQSTKKSYLISKDNMDFSPDMKKGSVPLVVIPVNGKSVVLEVKAVNNQVNSLKEGVSSPIVKGVAAFGFGTAAVASVAIGVSQALLKQSYNVSMIDKLYSVASLSTNVAKIGVAIGATVLVG
ncbi:MAG: hypothetical protein ACK4IX_09635, partial [Candidatus Sericytochromatia bacterium]